MIDVVLSNVEERDTDFAIISSFINKKEVRSLFFERINNEGELVKVFHSKTQIESDGHDGESDIILICENKNGKFAIFIEDKIAADPQPSQRQRYEDRANLLKVEEGYDKYYVVLCAPQAYLDTEKANGYEIKISHEEINACLDESDFEKHIFDFSTLEKKQGYVVVKNDAVTDFWDNLYKYIEMMHPHLVNKKKISAPRGGKAAWPAFNTGVKGLVIRWKTNFNCVDLEFAGIESNLNILENQKSLHNKISSIFRMGKLSFDDL